MGGALGAVCWGFVLLGFGEVRKVEEVLVVLEWQ